MNIKLTLSVDDQKIDETGMLVGDGKWTDSEIRHILIELGYQLARDRNLEKITKEGK